MLRKLILRWLFGTDNIEVYTDLLSKSIDYVTKHQKSIEDHIKTLDSQKEDLINIKKLCLICEKHGIDVDKEIKQVEY